MGENQIQPWENEQIGLPESQYIWQARLKLLVTQQLSMLMYLITN